jgi:peptidoglycan hydrolase-like protein with peptidoglycan-binding domain
LNSANKNFRWPASAFVAVLLVAASCLLAAGEGKAAPPQAKATKKKVKSVSGTKSKPAARPASSVKTVKHSSHSGAKPTVHSAKGRRRLPHSSRQRLALLHLDPQRVSEIQQALIREGALNGPPTGVWDESTKDAMRRYQSGNGFAETGLPDAKSLMKLGLGPHPLPDEVQAAAAGGQARVDALAHPNN